MRYFIQTTKRFIRKSPKFGFPSLCLVFALLANIANAQILYFDANGSTAGSGVIVPGGDYSWESPLWTTSSGGTTVTANFVEGSFAYFAAGSDSIASYTVTANADHSIGGMYFSTGTTNTLTINGSGVLSIASGLQGFTVKSGPQNLVIDSVLGGTGGLENEGSGSLSLYGNNTYSGGTTLGTAAVLNFNNNNSFGTGAITWGSNISTMTSQGTAPITLSNAVFTTAGVTNIFFGGATAPTTFKGAWTVASGGTSTLYVGSASPLTISGPIGGATNSIFNKAGLGTLILSGSNSLRGGLTLSSGTIQAGASGIFGNITKLTLSGNAAGGNFAANGFNQTTTGTLALGGSSTITFLGSETLKFANSSAVAWTAGRTLNLVNYDNGLFVGTDATGLTSAQLAEIEFNGSGLGNAQINSFGDIIDVPEPSTIALGLIGGLGMLWTVRRRTA